MKGYATPHITDNSDTGMVTTFESKLPFWCMDTNEFERRVKKLCDPDLKDKITLK